MHGFVEDVPAGIQFSHVSGLSEVVLHVFFIQPFGLPASQQRLAGRGVNRFPETDAVVARSYGEVTHGNVVSIAPGEGSTEDGGNGGKSFQPESAQQRQEANPETDQNSYTLRRRPGNGSIARKQSNRRCTQGPLPSGQAGARVVQGGYEQSKNGPVEGRAEESVVPNGT